MGAMRPEACSSLVERRGSEGVFRLLLSPPRRYEYVSPAVERLLGYEPAEFYADAGLVRELVVPEDRGKFDAADLDAFVPGGRLTLRFRHKEGRTVWIELVLWPVRESGRTVALEGSIRDASREHDDQANLARMARLLADAFDGVAAVDLATRRFAKADAKALGLLGVTDEAALASLSLTDVFDGTVADRLATAGALIASGEMDRFSVTAKIERPHRPALEAMVRVGLTGDCPPKMTLVLEDLSDERRLSAQMDRFRSAVAAAAEAIVLFDSSHSFLFANAAFCRLVGYSADQCTGFRPDILRALLADKELWAAVAEQEPWSGLIWGVASGNRHVQLMAGVSPIPEPGGETFSFVAVMREVTAENDAVAALSRERAALVRLTGALAELNERAPVEEIGGAMCNTVLALPEVAAAMLVDATVPEEPHLLAIRPERGFEALPRHLVSGLRVVELLARVESGRGWVEDTASLGGRGGPGFSLDGASRLVVSPMRHEGRTVGLLVVVGSDEARGLLRSLGDLASAAAGLLFPALQERADARRIRRELQSILGTRSLRPIFQPIIDLERLSTVGWEATTRFADETPPAERFADALRVGMVVDLEAVATKLAVAEVALNRPPGWLSLNVTSAFLASGDPLLSLLPRPPRQVVLELASASDLDVAARATLAALPGHVSLALDSTSNEMHTLRGIVELRPAFIKLPIGVVRGVDADHVRQALVAGLVHFAGATSSKLIAVGVETEAELSTLIDLGVEYAQGNYLGPPGFFPVADPSEAMPRREVAASP
jgi:PAS domain S-box-containing protein